LAGLLCVTEVWDEERGEDKTGSNEEEVWED
jgi:hypothetical protein